MNNEYNDYLILSPSKMEEVAKRYNEEIGKNKLAENCERKITNGEFYDACAQLIHTLLILKKYLLRKRKKDLRIDAIKDAIDMLMDIDENMKRKHIKIVKNYNEAVRICFSCLSLMLDISTKEENNKTTKMLTQIFKCLIVLL